MLGAGMLARPLYLGRHDQSPARDEPCRQSGARPSFCRQIGTIAWVIGGVVCLLEKIDTGHDSLPTALIDYDLAFSKIKYEP